MKKYYFILFTVCICWREGINAQIASDDVRVITIDFASGSNGVSNDHTLHNQVYLNLTNFSTGGLEWWYIPENPSYGPELQVFSGINGPINFPANSSNIQRTIQIFAKNSSGMIVDGKSVSVIFKATYTVNNSGFIPPDETWDISSSATFTPPVPDAFPVGSPYNGNAVSGGHAYIKFAPAHNGKLKKPLIFVEGIDFSTDIHTYNGTVIRHGSTGWDAIMMGNDAGGISDLNEEISYFNYYPQGINTLLNEEYDIIFLDFASGADYIQKNGFVLVKLIEMVNARRATDDPANASFCENVIVGASMGGQVSKWALSYMEANNIPHQSHTYISFDSPHKGANIPLGIQALAFMNTLIPGGGTDNWGRLNAPAARQMLLETLESGVASGRLGLNTFKTRYEAPIPFIFNTPVTTNLGFSGTEAIRQSFQNEMVGLGYPQRTRNVAISCGTSEGEQLDFANNDTYFKANLHINPSGFANIACSSEGEVLYVECVGLNGSNNTTFNQLIFDSAPGVGGCATQTINGQAQTLFLANLPTDFDNWVGSANPPVEHLVMKLKSNVNYPSFDNAPGCKRGDLKDIEIELSKASDDITFVNKIYTTFMPTLSLLDIQWPMDDEHLVEKLQKNIILSSGLTPFEDYYAPTENLRHVELTAAMVQFVVDQSALGRAQINVPPLTLVNGQQYNYGNVKKNVPDVVINSGTRLAVNVTGTINYMTPGDPVANKPHFEVFTGKGCIPGRTVLVKNGGILQIGDPNVLGKTGIFHAMKDAIIHIEPGGILRISNVSELRLYSGATLILDAGARVILDHPDSKIQIEGDLVVNGNIVFSGVGFFNFSQGNRLVYGPGYQVFNLQGAGKGHRMVQLDASLSIESGKKVFFRDGGMVVNGGYLRLNTDSDLTFDDMTVTGGDPAILSEGGDRIIFSDTDFANNTRLLRADQASLVWFVRCNAQNSGTVANILRTELVRVWFCENINSTFGFHLQQVKNLDVASSNFTGGYDGIFAELVDNITIGSCNFSNYKNESGTANENPNPDGASAIRLAGVPFCVVRNSTFTSNHIGICARIIGYDALDDPFEIPSNVFLLNHTVIQGGSAGAAGVYLEGDATSGMLLMDCSEIKGPKFSVKGTNVRLLIDAVNAMQHPLDGAQPNTFHIAGGTFDGTQRYFDICYDAITPGTIPMRNNYWSKNMGITTDFNPATSMDLFRGATCNQTVGVSTLLIRPMEPCVESDGPAPPSHGGEDARCALQASDLETEVGNQWHVGMERIKADDFEGALLAMEPVAALFQSDLSTYTPNCSQYIGGARSIVAAAKALKDSNQGDTKERSNLTKVDAGQLQIAPNPAGDQFTVTMTEGAGTLRIFDSLGRLQYEQRALSNVHRVPSADWVSGWYIVQVTTTDGQTYTAKVVVQ